MLRDLPRRMFARVVPILLLSAWAAQAPCELPSASVTLLGKGRARVNQVIQASLVLGTNSLSITNAPAFIDLASVQVSLVETSGAVRLIAAESVGSRDHGELHCQLEAAQSGSARLAISFQTRGLDVATRHTVQIMPPGDAGRLDTIVCIHNRSGMNLNNVRLVMPDNVGADVGTHPATIGNGESLYLALRPCLNIPVGVEAAYDGAVLDRFPRNPRTDWTYGTVSRRTAGHFLVAPPNSSWVTNLSAGTVRAIRERDDGRVEFLGEREIPAQTGDSLLRIPLDLVPGVDVVRERVGYSEVEPGHVYEESFEIRLSNAGDDPIALHVREHLYRCDTFEVVAADGEYHEAGKSVIEFLSVLKPAGKSVIRYTVRYRW